jgi:hypothetical protein
MSFKILTLNDSEEWNNLLAKLPAEQQDIYYTPEYYSLYEKNGDGKALCFVFEKDGNIALYPFLINSVNALGYNLDKEYFDIQGAYGYNGVVSSNYEKAFINEFYDSFNSFCAENKIIAEFTRFHPLMGNAGFSKNHLDVIFDRKTVYIDLQQDYNALYADFQRTTKKQIRRTIEKYGLLIENICNDESVVDVFYGIYTEAMRNVNAGKYLYFSEEYFKNLLKIDGVCCFFVIYQGQYISTITTMHYGEYLHGHLGGTLTDFLSFSPFSIMYDAMIKLGQKKGCRYLHVGGGATVKDDDPVLKYKLHFSKNTKDFFIGKKIYDIEIYKNVAKQWEFENPSKIEKYKNHLLKYRY